MLFPLNAVDGDIFTTADGKKYKWKDVAYAWIKQHTVTTIEYVEQPESIPVNAGDFNIVNSDSSAEIYTVFTSDNQINPFNSPSRATSGRLIKTPIIVNNNGSFNVVNSNSSSEIYALPTNSTSLDNFNSPSRLTSGRLIQDTSIVPGTGNFNISNSNYELELTV